MQHILLFSFVLTAIIFYSMFWASTGQKKSEIVSDLEADVPQNDSVATEVVPQQRKSDVDSMPNSSGSSKVTSSYSVLGVN